MSKPRAASERARTHSTKVRTHVRKCAGAVIMLKTWRELLQAACANGTAPLLLPCLCFAFVGLLFFSTMPPQGAAVGARELAHLATRVLSIEPSSNTISRKE